MIQCGLDVGGLAQYHFGKYFPLIPLTGIPGLAYAPVLVFSPYVKVSGKLAGDLVISGYDMHTFNYAT